MILIVPFLGPHLTALHTIVEIETDTRVKMISLENNNTQVHMEQIEIHRDANVQVCMIIPSQKQYLTILHFQEDPIVTKGRPTEGDSTRILHAPLACDFVIIVRKRAMFGKNATVYKPYTARVFIRV
jgi:hypothetical protein